jgi:hypothetical protein
MLLACGRLAANGEVQHEMLCEEWRTLPWWRRLSGGGASAGMRVKVQHSRTR